MAEYNIDLKQKARELSSKIRESAESSSNETEFRTKVSYLLEEIAKEVELNLHLREEYTFINGRADAVYNRLLIEYEPPRSLKESNLYRANDHAINQVKNYIEGIVKKERHRPERLAGVVLDGYYFIFVRKKENVWHVEDPLPVDVYSTEYFLKLLFSLSTELAIIPENLVRDFGENTYVSRRIVSAIFDALVSTENLKVKTLFEQWSLQFSEVCDYEETSKLKVESFARNFGIRACKVHPFQFFFCLHTYYATFIKLLAILIAHYYAMPKLGTNLKKFASAKMDELKGFLKQVEEGRIFRELGIINFIEGDFFSWYLDVWDEKIYEGFKALISALSNYSLVTLDVDPDNTRDLLKKLYQQLMPKELRHNLGEYYTPDWLAERVLDLLQYDGDPNKRLLDPACGSGTFLVLAIKRVRQYAWRNSIREDIALEKILSNIVGFDLNPLAVIAARTNYLLALGDLLQHRRGEINIPVYICDSILTPQIVPTGDLHDKTRGAVDTLKFSTVGGTFYIPKSLVSTQYIDVLSNFLEESVKLNLNKEQFIEAICQKLPLNPRQDSADLEVLYMLYEKLLELEKEGVNGIWARIIKNAFAPLFVGEFDYVAGNPPWINWEHLPEQYRRETIPLWKYYGLFPHSGIETILGTGKKDISMIMTYVSIDKYLRMEGRLGFLITQSVFKTAGSGQGFRRFILPDETPIRVLFVEDMVELKPFEGVANRTSIVILQKGEGTKYPIPYNYWTKKVKRVGLKDDMLLHEISEIATYKQFNAEPVNKNDLTSPWVTGTRELINVVRKILGESDYVAHEGINTGGANAVYWVNIVGKRPDGLVIISNITEAIKREVESIRTAVEPDLICPLLRGRDVKRWKAEPSAYILMVQDPLTRRGIDENELKTKYPKTYLYLKRFEDILRARPAFKRYFTRKGKRGSIIETGPFYSMFDVGDYTFAPYKVVWTRIANVKAAVVSKENNKSVIPQDTITMVPFNDEIEAYYVCGMINSSLFQYACFSYSQAGGKSMGSPHILENIYIPKFDPENELHLYLSELSQRAHEVAKNSEQENLKNLEEEIDEVAAQIWGVAIEELQEIKKSLKELGE